MEKEKKCNHKNKLSVYGRDEKNWISSLKIRGKMVYICEDCGDLFTEKVTKQDVVYTTDETEAKDEN